MPSRNFAPALVLLAALAGCADTSRTVAYHFPLSAGAARVFLHDAGATGPVLVEARGNPFATDVAGPYAAAASRTVFGLHTRFTADRAAAPRPDYRLVVQFNPSRRTTAAEICDPASSPQQQHEPGRLTVLVAFCHHNEPLLYATQTAPMADAPDSPVIRSLAQQAVLRMFEPVRESDPEEYWWPD